MEDLSQQQNNESTTRENLTQGFRDRPVIMGVPKIWVYVIAVTALVLAIVLIGLFVSSQRKISNLEKQVKQQQADPTAHIKEETKSLVEQVGKLIVLPTDEDPTIATVSDLDKLKEQPFFANAQLGDKVLIYTKAQKAILFRTSENKIIELAPINNGTPNVTK